MRGDLRAYGGGDVALIEPRGLVRKIHLVDVGFSPNGEEFSDRAFGLASPARR
jgi:hypothetical protein